MSNACSPMITYIITTIKIAQFFHVVQRAFHHFPTGLWSVVPLTREWWWVLVTVYPVFSSNHATHVKMHPTSCKEKGKRTPYMAVQDPMDLLLAVLLLLAAATEGCILSTATQVFLDSLARLFHRLHLKRLFFSFYVVVSVEVIFNLAQGERNQLLLSRCFLRTVLYCICGSVKLPEAPVSGDFCYRCGCSCLL